MSYPYNTGNVHQRKHGKHPSKPAVVLSDDDFCKSDDNGALSNASNLTILIVREVAKITL